MCTLSNSIILACVLVAFVSLGFAVLALTMAKVCDAIKDHNLRMMQVFLKGQRR